MTLSALQNRLGVKFNDESLLVQALTHSSVRKQEVETVSDYERLEFLGDRVLGLVVAEALWLRHGDENEGWLSKHHAALVREATLAEIALDWGLNELVQLGPGERSAGGERKPSILADCVEALLAVIYLEHGLAPVKKLIERDWLPRMGDIEVREPKTHLQEWLQAKGDPLPRYELVSADGADHQRLFTYKVVSRSYGEAQGSGPSKRTAQQEAARTLLAQIESDA